MIAATIRNTAQARLSLLYGRTPSELFRTLESAATHTPEIAAKIRVEDAGAADRAERFAEHCDAMRRQALVLRQRLIALAEVERGAPDAA